MSGYEVIRSLEATLYPYAECEECAWSKSTSPTTRDIAKRHVGITGHSVLVVAETRSRYIPNGEKK